MTPSFVSDTGKMETPFTYKAVEEADFGKVRGPGLDIVEMSHR